MTLYGHHLARPEWALIAFLVVSTIPLELLANWLYDRRDRRRPQLPPPPPRRVIEATYIRTPAPERRGLPKGDSK